MTGKNDKGLLASVKSSGYRADGTVKVGISTWTFLGSENKCNSGSKIENCLANSWDDLNGTATFFLLQNNEKLRINLELELELTQDLGR
jgi:hypothetical protein